jgi:hypothetical protein
VEIAVFDLKKHSMVVREWKIVRPTSEVSEYSA